MAQETAAARRIKLTVSIVDRGKGERVAALLHEDGAAFHIIGLGRGTADSTLLDYLGLGQTEKDVVFSSVREDLLPAALQRLRTELQLDQPGGGVVFTIPITSVGGPNTLRILAGLFGEETGPAQ